MSERAFRCSFTSVLVFALSLVVLPSVASAQETPRLSREARAAFEAVASPEAKACGLCAFAHQHCSSACFSLADKGGMGKCLTQCDNAAAACSCDKATTLRSEDLVSQEWLSSNKAACNASVSCQPNFPSCASWSAYSDCDTPFCGSGPRCGECTCDEWGHCFCGPGPAWKQYRQRFRVCFDAGGNSCTEWQRVLISSCGCPEP